jgi:mono/diheme cytochrome c family protein
VTENEGHLQWPLSPPPFIISLFGLPAISAGRPKTTHELHGKMANQPRNAIWHVRACAGALIVLGAALSPATTSSAQDQAKIEAGENVFNTNCAVCHGDQLVSTGQTFDLRRLKDSDRARFDNSVRNGKNQMPPWKGKLTDEEIDQVWHYIRANAYQK